MRLFTHPVAPNPIKVAVFLAERGLSPELVDITTLDPAEYRRINPLGTVPALETNSGDVITESLTICQYLDETGDGPSLFGSNPEERAKVALWERRAELMLLNPAIEFAHHTHPMFAGKIRQYPDWARGHAAQGTRMIELMDQQLERSQFLAGDRFTMADLTAFLGYSALTAWGAVPPSSNAALARWRTEVASRPSMAPLRAVADQLGLKLD